ncbi:MAG: TA system VapC family ribonuclease toxin [Candidatus Sulfotelmatobacter sp.]
MIVVDANLLIYSYDKESTNHAKSREWVEKIFSEAEDVGLPWQTVCAFLRVVTNRRLPGSRLTVEQATQIVDAWLEQPNVRILAPGDEHWSVLKRMIIEGRASGPLVSDAELVALTVEYGGVLYSADRDFAKFPGLRWVNPLD